MVVGIGIVSRNLSFPLSVGLVKIIDRLLGCLKVYLCGHFYFLNAYIAFSKASRLDLCFFSILHNTSYSCFEVTCCNT